VLVDEDWDRITPLGSHGPDAEVEALELNHAVLSAMTTALTARQRAVFVGIVVHGASIEQLAAQLGSNRNAVYQLMFHARRNLRRQLAQRGLMCGVPSS
jgi:RNA polymerase sigma-70 factor (ECF subfamily)